MSAYNYWKSIKRVAIVYKPSYNKQSLPKAYVVDASDTKSRASAIKWAGSDAEIIETDNEGFTLTLDSAATDSSVGGKLSFWMCKIEKKGIKPCLVGINAELLFDVIVSCNLDHGKCPIKLEFARQYGQLGLLHKDMPSYKEMIADETKKAEIKSSKKTSVWKPGYVYRTTTTQDVCIGYLSNIVERVVDYHKYEDPTTYDISFNRPKKAYYDYYYEQSSPTSESVYNSCVKYICDRTGFDAPLKYPARQESDKVFDITESQLMDDVFNQILDETETNYEVSKRLCAITMFWHVDPQKCINKLKEILKYIEKDLAIIAAKTGKPKFVYRSHSGQTMEELIQYAKEYYKRYTEDEALKQFGLIDTTSEYLIKTESNSYMVHGTKELYTKVIEILESKLK